jgi:hypothetical protein
MSCVLTTLPSPNITKNGKYNNIINPTPHAVVTWRGFPPE